MTPPRCCLHREFNVRWHNEGEEKDEAERAAKAALKQKGAEELRGHLNMKAQQVAKKKETNRCVAWVFCVAMPRMGSCVHTIVSLTRLVQPLRVVATRP